MNRRKARTRRGWTREQLASRVGVTRVAIAGIEIANRRPSLDLLERRAKTLKVSLTRRPSLFTILKATRPEHVRENAGALDFTLTPEDLSAIDAEFWR